MESLIYAILASLFIGLVSLVGVVVLIKKLNRKSIIVTTLISFAAGTLIGDVLWHLLPESIEVNGFESSTIFGIFAGILIMILVEAYFHCSHDSNDDLHNHKSHLAKINIIGDGIHNLLDGIAIGVAFLVDPISVGIPTVIAIALHEIPQELADVSIMIYSGWRRRRIIIVNFLTALTSVFGVVMVFILNELVENVELFLVPIAIGQFIYIALADLLPEIHKNKEIKSYIIKISAFILGFGIMYLLTLAE